MKEIILVALRDMSGPAAFSIAVLVAGLTAIITIPVALRRSHQETMTQLADDHAERMLKINRDNPKQIEGNKGSGRAP